MVFRIGCFCCMVLISAMACAAEPVARTIAYLGYDDAIELSNGEVRVVLCPRFGGRVLEFSTGGKNALYVDEREKNWTPESKRAPSMSAGRFDIGPELVIPRRPNLWQGRWKGEITGKGSAKLTSMKDAATGVQLAREFSIDKKGMRLVCKQTMTNVSNATTQWCFWTRTFALGNGICVLPLKGQSKYPAKYAQYEAHELINMNPKDPAIRVRDGFVEIMDVPKHPKLGFDSQAGWFAYLMQNDLMFVKQFDVFPDRVYNEAAGLTTSIWYPEDRRVELEPIGPRETLEPGESGSFTEVWWLVPFEFPEKRDGVDLEAVERAAKGVMGSGEGRK
ncbi:MAG: hypothetical protein CMJ48_11965 [Planctomycetaceae bacterium]|nr:hypothetical protein [Planctomycetaceae bacterium]